MVAIRPLPTALAEKARIELNEDPKTLKSDIQILKDWIAKQPHLRARTDDQWLVAFLRGCKFSLERAKEKIDLYYSVRSTTPELYRIKHSEPTFIDILETGSVLILPKTFAPDAPRIFMIRPGSFDANKYNICDIMSVAYILQQISMMEDDNAIVAGFETILDLQYVNLGHFMQMTPSVIKNIVVSTQDAAPIRLKGIHCLNTPPGIETIFNAMRSLLNEKNRNRLFVHNKNYDAMYKIIPQAILPIEYGGKSGTIKDTIDYWKKKTQDYSSFLEENEKYGIDESKRTKAVPTKTTETGTDLEGSFRQLAFD